MGCTNSRERQVEKYIRERFADTVDKISPEQLNILKIIYFDLALRNPHKKVEKETFFVFFQKNGLWGHRLFKEFDIDNTDFVCLQEFIFSTGKISNNQAKIIKADQETKIGLLYKFFAFGNEDKNDGIVYSDFLRVLYNYSKQQLKSMLQAEYMIDDQLKQQLIDVLKNFEQTNPNYSEDNICLEMKEKTDNVFQSNVYQYLDPKDVHKTSLPKGSYIGKPSKGGSNNYLQVPNTKKNASNEKINTNILAVPIQKPLYSTQEEKDIENLTPRTKKIDSRYRQSGMLLQVDNKNIIIKTGSYHAIVKKVAGLIFNHFKIDKKYGRLFEAQFVQWIKLHKNLYESYYRGFNQRVWEMKDGKLRYLSQVSEIESEGVYVGQIFVNGEQTEKKSMKSCRVFLQKSILFVSEQHNKANLYNIICLEGLQVAKIRDEKLGFGIEIKHKNNVYPKKDIFFKNEEIFKKWMQHLKDYKGFNLHEKYQVGMQIGAGKYSIVYECKQRHNSKRYAMKEIDFFRLASQEKAIISHESHIMGVLHHPNLIKFRETIKTKNKIFIITELVEGKALQQYVRDQQAFSQKEAVQISRQIMNGIDYLHHLGIVHRDLKPENIMIQLKESNHAQVKIIDFGFANYIKNFQFSNEEDAIVGTPNYIAPQVYRKKKVTEKSDIFSIGVIIFFMLSGELPFNSDNLEFLIERTLTEKCQFVGKKWLKVSKDAKDLIQKLLEVDLQKRISLKEALNHQWFKTQRNISRNGQPVDEKKQTLRNSRKAILY